MANLAQRLWQRTAQVIAPIREAHSHGTGDRVRQPEQDLGFRLPVPVSQIAIGDPRRLGAENLSAVFSVVVLLPRLDNQPPGSDLAKYGQQTPQATHSRLFGFALSLASTCGHDLASLRQVWTTVRRTEPF